MTRKRKRRARAAANERAGRKRRVVIVPRSRPPREVLWQLCARADCRAWWAADQPGGHARCRRCDVTYYCGRPCRAADAEHHAGVCGVGSAEQALASLLVQRATDTGSLSQALHDLRPAGARGVLYAAARPGQDGLACAFWPARDLEVPQKAYLRDLLAQQPGAGLLVEALLKPADLAQTLPAGWFWWHKQSWAVRLPEPPRPAPPRAVALG